METKVKGNHIMGWVRRTKDPPFHPKQSSYRICIKANLCNMEKLKVAISLFVSLTHIHICMCTICGRVPYSNYWEIKVSWSGMWTWGNVFSFYSSVIQEIFSWESPVHPSISLQQFSLWSSREANRRGWRGDSVFKGAYWPLRAPECLPFIPLHPYGSSQPSPVSERPKAFHWPLWAHMWYTYVHTAKHTHKIKINTFKNQANKEVNQYLSLALVTHKGL